MAGATPSPAGRNSHAKGLQIPEDEGVRVCLLLAPGSPQGTSFERRLELYDHGTKTRE